MSRFSRLRTVGSSAQDEKGTYFFPNAIQNPKTCRIEAASLPGDQGAEVHINGTGQDRAESAAPRHRRGNSASEMSLKRHLNDQLLGKKSGDEPMPELFLGAPLENMDDTQKQTWQTQWADALKKVQSLRYSGAGTQSERWSGVATDMYRPNSFSTQEAHPSRRKTSKSTASSLDRWNYYPGPSISRDVSQSQLENMIREEGAGDDHAWSSFLHAGTMSNREQKDLLGDTTGNLLPGRGARSITTDSRPQSMQQSTSKGFGLNNSSLNHLNEPQRSKTFSGLSGRVQRTQSHRYGRLWGQKTEDDHLVEPETNYNSAANQNASIPNPILKKAISMREGGAHADAVMEMARVYTETIGGFPKTLECAACGRNLGLIVEGNPGVDISFCHACRPSPLQWKQPTSDNAAAVKKKKGVVHFCRKLLRLEKKSSQTKQ